MVYSYPQATSRTGPGMADTLVNELAPLTNAPSPSCPHSLQPIAYKSPALESSTEWRLPVLCAASGENKEWDRGEGRHMQGLLGILDTNGEECHVTAQQYVVYGHTCALTRSSHMWSLLT